jgi:hypothetical protein
MRTALIFALCAAPAPAEAGTCRWDDTGPSPLRRYDSVFHFQRAYDCPADARGTLELTLTAQAGGKSVELHREKRTLEPQGRWARHFQWIEKAWPNKLCELAEGGAAVLRDGKPVTPVKVTVLLAGTGDMSGLSWSGSLDMFCQACRRAGGDVSLKEDRGLASALTAKTRLVAALGDGWEGCKSLPAKLELRFFFGKDQREALNAVKPDFVIGDLAPELRAGKKIDRALPLAEMCRAARGRKVVVWELGGVGPIADLLGGGRSVHDIRCGAGP